MLVPRVFARDEVLCIHEAPSADQRNRANKSFIPSSQLLSCPSLHNSCSSDLRRTRASALLARGKRRGLVRDCRWVAKSFCAVPSLDRSPSLAAATNSAAATTALASSTSMYVSSALSATYLNAVSTAAAPPGLKAFSIQSNAESFSKLPCPHAPIVSLHRCLCYFPARLGC